MKLQIFLTMKIFLGFIILHIVNSLPLESHHESNQSPTFPKTDDTSENFQQEITTGKKRSRRKTTSHDIMLEITRRIPRKTSRYRLPRISRRKYNRTKTTISTSTTRPTLPASYWQTYSYPHTIFDPIAEKEKLIPKVALYFNMTEIPEDLQPFYIWYYNVLHDEEGKIRRDRVIRFHHSYVPAYKVKQEILAHTIFQVPEEHEEYYVLVNDLAAETKDPTVITFPKEVTFLRTKSIGKVVDDLLYGLENVKDVSGNSSQEYFEGPNIFYTTRPPENTTTTVTTTTIEPEPFYQQLNFDDLYQEKPYWETTTKDYYEGLDEFLEKLSREKNPDDDDKTYFF